MRNFKKLHLLHLLLSLNILSSASSQETNYCGTIKIQQPFIDQKIRNHSSLLTKIILCKSEKLYFRTIIGLFEIDSINYDKKLIVVSNASSSPSSLSLGFPPDSSGGESELGTRISFDIPDHVPDPCNECEKPYGNCGVGLRCACHPKKCKDKVISAGAALRPCGDMLVLIYLVLFIAFLHGF